MLDKTDSIELLVRVRRKGRSESELIELLSVVYEAIKWVKMANPKLSEFEIAKFIMTGKEY